MNWDRYSMTLYARHLTAELNAVFASMPNAGSNPMTVTDVAFSLTHRRYNVMVNSERPGVVQLDALLYAIKKRGIHEPILLDFES